MKTNETYRPANIEFDVDGGFVPMNFGIEFEDVQEANQFIAANMIAINTKARVTRYMDNFEKNEIRKEYQELLEQKIPMLERELMKAKAAFDEAKKAYADSQEYVSATTNEAKALAVEVRRGTKEEERWQYGIESQPPNLATKHYHCMAFVLYCVLSAAFYQSNF